MTALATGARVGVYEIASLLGVGGMGEVYRARDTKLGRDVAIKILPSIVASDPDRLARFEREARLLASLNHPHIAQIYGVEESVGVTALVLELVEGETLATRIARLKGSRSTGWKDALDIARQIADALDAAHERGIVHRDLKPANVIITPDGTVKVLDFGLATERSASLSGERNDALTHSPTVIGPTAAGVLLGTAPYMSPEQARGKVVDKRTDIWAFGCVLYEMLSGRRTFPGETTTDAVAAILEREPDWSELPPSTPPHVAVLLRRCLEKDPKLRLRDIGDARADLDPGAPVSVEAVPRRARGRAVVPVLAAALVAAIAVLAWMVLRRAPVRQRPVQFTFGAPEDVQLDATAPIPSPDGSHLAFVARAASGQRAIWVRDIGATTIRRIPETDDVSALPPFWSPDSRWIGFFAAGKLKKVSLSGGPALTICAAPNLLGGTWNADNVIVFGQANRNVLHKVSAAGGTSEPITTLNAERKENSHRWPRFLPDGRHFLFTARSDVIQNNIVYVGSLDSKDVKPLVAAQSNAAYGAGYLLFAREGTLMAQRFDPTTMSLSGEAVAVASRIRHNTPSSEASFGVSADGAVLAYQAGLKSLSKLTWFDRTGHQIAAVGAENNFTDVRLSPDGKIAAVVVPDSDSGNRDIWLVDLGTGTMTRFTSNPANDWQMIWSPDGRQLAWASDRNGRSSIYVKSIDGTEETLLLRAAERGAFPKDWSRDGGLLTINLDSTGGVPAMYAMRLTGDRTPFPIGVGSGERENEAMLTRDAKTIAFTSRQSGVDEVYVARFPSGARRRVSTSGGSAPRWKADDRELYYVAPDGWIMAAPIAGPDSMESGVPLRLLRPCGGTPVVAGAYAYDVTADGSRFLAICASPSSNPSSITVSLDWTATIK